MSAQPWPSPRLLKPLTVAVAAAADAARETLGARHSITRHLVAALEEAQQLLGEAREAELRQAKLPLDPPNRAHGRDLRRARVLGSVERFARSRSDR